MTRAAGCSESQRNLVRRTYRDRAIERRAGTCTFLGPGNVAPTMRGATMCGSPAVPTGIDASVNLLSGFTPPNVVRVELVGSHGTLPIAFETGAFLAELPSSPQAGKGPGPVPGGPYRVVGYDRHGREVGVKQLR